MAIRVMTEKSKAFDEAGNLLPNVEVVTNYPGHEKGVHHRGRKCPHHGKVRNGAHEGFTPECVTSKWIQIPDELGQVYGRGFNALTDPLTGEPRRGADGEILRGEPGGDYCVVFDELYMVTTHVGVVIDPNGENNFHDDSDFYAVVWNVELKKPENVYFGSTRGWTYPNNAWADATPEVLEAYRAYQEDRLRRQDEAEQKAAAEKRAAEAKLPRKGARCRVVRGRKVPVGTEGVCIWVGGGEFGPRVGIKDADGKTHWTAMKNVEAVAA